MPAGFQGKLGPAAVAAASGLAAQRPKLFWWDDSMEFARQEYLWLLLPIPLVAAFWGIGVWHRRRMRIGFGNIESLESISRISSPALAWVRGALFASSLVLMTLGLAFP